jgi:CRISPR-associated protein Cas5d
MSFKKEKEFWREKFCRENHVEYEVSGNLALFADPVTSAGGEKTTYSIPTYEALKGITKSIYWKPTFIWIVDKVRVMNQIRTESMGTKLPRINGDGQDLANYTYLMNVKYQVQAHLEWNENRPEYSEDRDINKHYGVFAKALLKGGRLPVFLGKSECCADVSICEFGDGLGAYDHSGIINFGYMYHGITYPDESYSEETRGRLTLDIAPVLMNNGIIEYKRPEECSHQEIRNGLMKEFERKDDEHATPE